ncbi:MAG: PAS domain-containing sensor histidine kinase, partial [Chthoniobacterales bacterium]
MSDSPKPSCDPAPRGAAAEDARERSEPGEEAAADRALRESEERFRQFAENSADAFWIVDAKTLRLEYVNPVYEKIFGQPIKLLLEDKEKRLEVVLAEDREATISGMATALGGETFVRHYRVRRPNDGEVRWIRDTGFPIFNDTGEVSRVAGVARDVTEERNRGEELRLSEERFRLLVEGARDHAMFLLNPERVITYWSSGAARVFGWAAEEAVGQSGELIFTPEDRASGRVEKEMDIALHAGVAPDRRFHLRKDGTRVWIDGVMRRLDHEDGSLRGFAKVARDASDLHRAEEELVAARDKMEERVRERTQELLAMNRELEQTIAQRQQLEKELLEISEREKRRIGEDLHDMVCQELTATALFLKSTAKRLEPESASAAATLEEAAQTVNRNVGLTRDLARGLQPAELQGAGLKQALRALALQACENSDVKCHFKATRGVRVMDHTIALHLYR